MTKEQAIEAAQAAYRADPDYWDRKICRLEPRQEAGQWVVLAWFGLVCIVCADVDEVAELPEFYERNIAPLWAPREPCIVV